MSGVQIKGRVELASGRLQVRVLPPASLSPEIASQIVTLSDDLIVVGQVLAANTNGCKPEVESGDFIVFQAVKASGCDQLVGKNVIIEVGAVQIVIRAEDDDVKPEFDVVEEANLLIQDEKKPVKWYIEDDSMPSKVSYTKRPTGTWDWECQMYKTDVGNFKAATFSINLFQWGESEPGPYQLRIIGKAAKYDTTVNIARTILRCKQAGCAARFPANLDTENRCWQKWHRRVLVGHCGAECAACPHSQDVYGDVRGRVI
jgi:hypothetical protein